MTDATTEIAVTLRSESFSFWQKAAYAIGDLGNSAGPGTIIPFWYLYFLTDVARLNPALAGLSILLEKLWDAVNDPLVGWLSDRRCSLVRWSLALPIRVGEDLRDSQDSQDVLGLGRLHGLPCGPR